MTTLKQLGAAVRARHEADQASARATGRPVIPLSAEGGVLLDAVAAHDCGTAKLRAILQAHLDWFDGKFMPVDEDAFIAETRAVLAKHGGAF